METIDRVFCNRSLNMESIQAIGFDMDYTLALYNPHSFETLVYKSMLTKMVENGYPKEILSWEFDYSSMIRGLVIDKQRGNILKIDRHHYVKIACHGFKTLSHDERVKHYDLNIAIDYKEPNFAFLDTFFALAEAFLVSKLVEYQDSNINILTDKTYFDFYTDVRKYLDLAHRDTSFKKMVAENPAEYLTRDPLLPEVLHELKKCGKKLFILTNSLWDYVNAIMTYLLPCNEKSNYKNWTEYFDFVFTGSQKPQFFTSKNLLYEVDSETGLLKNLPNSHGVLPNKNIKFFQGGHVHTFQDMLGIKKGSEILYVGDHIYGDIVKSKKDIGWRTLLVIDELTNELQNKHHAIWGSVLKTGHFNSFFSEQMSHYACLYTSKFTNLRHYNLEQEAFKAAPDLLAHEV